MSSSLGGDLSYELDLFGRVRNTVADARASEQASAGDVAALDLALHAELATDYFTLRGLDVEQQLLDQTVGDYARALQLTQNLYQRRRRADRRRAAGPGAARDRPHPGRGHAPAARADRARHRGAGRARGRAPSALRAPPGEHLPQLPPWMPGLPSQLLERRPDVAAAERRVAAANAKIGVARAAYFPVFSLTGSAGCQSTQTANWLSAPSQYWSLGPQAVLTLFDAGLRRAQSAQAHAVYDEQVADYRGTVLTAYQDVEDNLAALRQLQRRASARRPPSPRPRERSIRPTCATRAASSPTLRS